jgi:hypothetical protein
LNPPPHEKKNCGYATACPHLAPVLMIRPVVLLVSVHGKVFIVVRNCSMLTVCSIGNTTEIGDSRMRHVTNDYTVNTGAHVMRAVLGVWM